VRLLETQDVHAIGMVLQALENSEALAGTIEAVSVKRGDSEREGARVVAHGCTAVAAVAAAAAVPR
jgi:hypothetical protein